ncbi:hypothetical protein CDO52_24690 [Nocardiopsis gilva YIM 90087]|uniref:DUF4190 domain-containing protein n=1 Tax=Nocardiopsis gilva YIM 90087 TaxID=1235441 RepID=A0A223SBY5_9ACTN|nr:DUF4190 domain-containing protein [Nocardiopsis gilva]ASU85573.1 hypothetical protein CDO52_24690 [Nocardiopsis gilva YIM 90087]
MSNEPTEPRADGQPPAVERGGLWGLILSTAGLVLLFPMGVLLSILGIYQGHKARRAAKQNNTTAPGAIPSVVLGWLGVAISALGLIGMLMFWSEFDAYQQCSSRAHTVSTQRQCDETLQEDLRDAIAQRTGLPKEQVPMPNMGV